MRIRTKYILVLVSMVAAVTVGISFYLFSVNDRLSVEYRSRNLSRLETALNERARDDAASLSALTASAALQPMYLGDVGGVGNIVKSLLDRPEVISATIYARDGTVFHDGTDDRRSFGQTGAADVIECIARADQKIEVRADNTIRIITPIMRNGSPIGGLEAILDAAFVERQVATLRADLLNASERERAGQVGDLLAVSLIALVLAGVVAAILAGRLSAPIRELANATRRVSRGDFSVDTASRRGDELGELANAFDQMSRTLRETMVSRSDLQKTVVDQTRELRGAHDSLLALEADRREVLQEISEELRAPIGALEADAEHALRNHDSALELRHSMSRLLFRIRDVRRLVDDLRFASGSDEPRRAGRREREAS